ncbi:hypothetical protein GCM10009037_25170 [Halarchaeum grantii]|uniref:Uncharacterized protein n=1 Tax=Halarchaeum grantii TaxID=1193105 RepID=A0A830F585_9EURY|nr:hypothetical protein GCM10009037_25170 [Halarchaeum grantii]
MDGATEEQFLARPNKEVGERDHEEEDGGVFGCRSHDLVCRRIKPEETRRHGETDPKRECRDTSSDDNREITPRWNRYREWWRCIAKSAVEERDPPKRNTLEKCGAKYELNSGTVKDRNTNNSEESGSRRDEECTDTEPNNSECDGESHRSDTVRDRIHTQRCAWAVEMLVGLDHHSIIYESVHPSGIII